MASLVAPSAARAAGPDADATEASPPAPPWKADPLFPGAGHGSLAVASGVPFVAMGEAAYAPTDHFAIGAIVGVTPFVLGVGVRPRFGLLLGGRTRVSLVTPVLYYPTGEGLVGNGPPWFLAQPALRLEAQVGDVGYLHASAGIIAALGLPSHDERGETVVTYNDRRVVERGTPWGIWNTVGGGGAIAVANHTVVLADAMLILRGARAAGDEWIGGPPFAFTLGIARSL